MTVILGSVFKAYTPVPGLFVLSFLCRALKVADSCSLNSPGCCVNWRPAGFCQWDDSGVTVGDTDRPLTLDNTSPIRASSPCLQFLLNCPNVVSTSTRWQPWILLIFPPLSSPPTLGWQLLPDVVNPWSISPPTPV